MQMMKFMHMTKDNTLTSSVGSGKLILDWCIDASFDEHPDCRSHSSMTMKFRGRKGCPMSRLDKQRLNSDGSTAAELISVHDHSPKVLWTPPFLSAQGHALVENNVH